MSGRPLNNDRQNAIDLGLQTYEGAPHRNCGRTTRYVRGGSCVHCARAIATEQREARKYLRVRDAARLAAETAIEDAHDEQVADDLFALDTAEPMALEEDDAEARRQASFDELM